MRRPLTDFKSIIGETIFYQREMAEQGQDQGAPDFAGLILNQSKAKEDELTGFSDLSNPGEGKNKLILVCEN